MDRPFIIGVFTNEHDILGAVKETRSSGYDIYDVFTPYAVHGLDEAMGLKPSRLTYVCFLFALLGLLTAIITQFWIGSIDWPLNVGGKPFNSLPAYLPVAFELTVLFGGLGVVFVMLLRSRLYPGKKELSFHPRVSDDRFVLVIEVSDAVMDEDVVRPLWENYSVEEVKRIVEMA
ncbi:MAG: DUF3341 domain-containing protein [Chlorobi bacterium]|nr:DUF3341 domain-containing protein [Chlorobiota bacterium]